LRDKSLVRNMKQFQAGTGSDIAEFIVDYRKRKVQILDTQKRYALKNKDLNFTLTPFFLVFIIPMLLFAINLEILGDRGFTIYFFSFMLMIYQLLILLTPIRKKLHKYGQFFFNDYFRVKKFMIIKDIQDKVWQLPSYVSFSNLKFDYKLYGDYAKFIEKSHIKPKNYYLGRNWENKERQKEKWDAFFYFSKIPKTGKMELEWI